MPFVVYYRPECILTMTTNAVQGNEHAASVFVVYFVVGATWASDSFTTT